MFSNFLLLSEYKRVQGSLLGYKWISPTLQTLLDTAQASISGAVMVRTTDEKYLFDTKLIDAAAADGFGCDFNNPGHGTRFHAALIAQRDELLSKIMCDISDLVRLSTFKQHCMCKIVLKEYYCVAMRAYYV